MNLFTLIAKLGLDTKEYSEKLNEAKKEASSFSSKVGTTMKTAAKGFTALLGVVTTVGTAIVGFGTKMIDLGGEIDDNAQQLGMSTEQYQEWSFAMTKAGTDASTLQVVMRELSTFTQELSEGQADALITLDKLGIGYADFMAQDNAGQLAMLVTALQGVESSTDKASLAQELFGNRAYQKLMPLLNEEQGSLEQLNKTLHEQGVIISNENIQAAAQLGDKVDLLKATFTSFGLKLATDVFPEIGELIDTFQELATGSDDTSKKIAQSITGIIDKVAGELPKLIDDVGDFLISLVDGILPILPDIADKLLDIAINLLDKLAENAPMLIGNIIEATTDIINKVVGKLPDILESAVNVVIGVVEGLITADNLKSIIETVLNFAVTLTTAMIKTLPTLMNNIRSSLLKIIKNLLTGENIGSFIAVAINFGAEFVAGIIEGFGGFLDGFIDFFTSLFSGDFEALRIFDGFGLNLAGKIIAGIVSGLESNLDTSIFDKIKDLFSTENLKKYGDQAVNLGISLVNGIIKGLNNLAHIRIPGLKIGDWQVWDDVDIQLFKIPEIAFKKFAKGGMLEDLFGLAQGTAYAVAGESGAEIVAQGRQGTGVANVEQIAEAQYQGLEEYGLKEAIMQAAAAVVNGIVDGLKMGENDGSNTSNITVKIGERDFKSYIVKIVNETLGAQGRKSLNAITAY